MLSTLIQWKIQKQAKPFSNTATTQIRGATCSMFAEEILHNWQIPQGNAY